jgi:hypothetical protein
VGMTTVAARNRELVRELEQIRGNVTAAQTRASTLLEEAGALRAELQALGPLLDVVRELGTEERAVLLVLARRLLLGQRSYGRLDLAKDGRDWRAERAAELADALIYETFAALSERPGDP